MALNGKKAFGYDTGAVPSGVQKIGNLALLTASTIVEGVTWWAPPDGSTGYVISVINPGGNQPNPLGLPAYNGFYRSQGFSNAEFIKWTNVASGQNYTTPAQAQSWLDNNSAWSSYEDDYPKLINEGSYALPRTDTSNPFVMEFWPFVAGVPHGIIVFAVNYTSATNRVTDITYGGLNMTFVTGATDNAGETGNIACYFLGSGLPEFLPQNIVVTFDSATTDDYYIIAYGVDNDKGLDTQLIDYKILQGDQANPQVTLQTNGYPCRSFCALFSGVGTLDAIPTAGTDAPWYIDLGQETIISSLSDTTNKNNLTIGFNGLASDDVAFVALNIASI